VRNENRKNQLFTQNMIETMAPLEGNGVFQDDMAPQRNVTFAVNYELSLVDSFLSSQQLRKPRRPSGTTASEEEIGFAPGSGRVESGTDSTGVDKISLPAAPQTPTRRNNVENRAPADNGGLERSIRHQEEKKEEETSESGGGVRQREQYQQQQRAGSGATAAIRSPSPPPPSSSFQQQEHRDRQEKRRSARKKEKEVALSRSRVRYDMQVSLRFVCSIQVCLFDTIRALFARFRVFFPFRRHARL